ncbi:unnamed protein product [Pleuronectes platessa]|uniref:Uncharacterized protein n=1 Tax=Pleuronectes platessa TaxID=8262 RepID=A0A9N7V244_PLEPL|nr:unnamed protein product [Pleuronectes platessa]
MVRSRRKIREGISVISSRRVMVRARFKAGAKNRADGQSLLALNAAAHIPAELCTQAVSGPWPMSLWSGCDGRLSGDKQKADTQTDMARKDVGNRERESEKKRQKEVGKKHSVQRRDSWGWTRCRMQKADAGVGAAPTCAGDQGPGWDINLWEVVVLPSTSSTASACDDLR